MVSGKGSDLSVPVFLSYKVETVTVTALFVRLQRAREPEPWEQSLPIH